MAQPNPAHSSRQAAGRTVIGYLAVLLLAMSAWLPLPASADALDDAKSAGLVGEMATGYLGIVRSSVDPQIRKLVNEINARRRAEYQRIAARNGVELEAVEKLAGGKAIQRSKPGEYINTGNGWQRR